MNQLLEHRSAFSSHFLSTSQNAGDSARRKFLAWSIWDFEVNQVKQLLCISWWGGERASKHACMGWWGGSKGGVEGERAS